MNKKYKVPFLVLLIVCILLAVALIVIVMLPGRSSLPSKKGIMFPTMEGEITEVLHGTQYFQTFAFRTTDGTVFHIDIRPFTEIYDPEGEPVLVSGLTPGLRVKVFYEGIVNSVVPYNPEDGKPGPTHFQSCPKIQILS